MTADQTEAEQSIVRSVSAIVGPRPIILAGSRATGEATAESDYDVYVVLSGQGVLRHVRGLRRAADALTADLGVSVTLNPLPAFRLARPGRTLIVWKLHREGRVLAPPTFRLSAPGAPVYNPVAVSSYALSGLRYLVEDFDPRTLADTQLPPATSARVRKALRHLVQIELLAGGRYEPSLVAALAALPSSETERLVALETGADLPRAWFEVRDLLVQHSRRAPDPLRTRVAVNAQYVALQALRTKRIRLGSMLFRRSIAEQLDDALVRLALAVGPNGAVDNEKLYAVAALLPGTVAEETASWSHLRDRIDALWADSHPLVGF